MINVNEILTLVEAGYWGIVSITPYGQIFEKLDGSVIVTGSWDGNGMKYEVHYNNKHEDNTCN